MSADKFDIMASECPRGGDKVAHENGGLVHGWFRQNNGWVFACVMPEVVDELRIAGELKVGNFVSASAPLFRRKR